MNLKPTRKLISIFIITITCFLMGANSNAKPLPTPLTGAIILKLLALESNAASSNQLSILVINDPELVNYLNKKVGTPIGNSSLIRVWQDQIPDNLRPDVIYFNNSNNITNTVSYAKSVRALTISNDRAHAKNGVVLFIFDDEGLPGIAINIAASKTMGFKWSDKILEISSAIQ